MCGIVGYLGSREAFPVVIKGLQRLEYRGYDSAGVMLYDGSEVRVSKTKGKVFDLKTKAEGEQNIKGSLGIGHTRWATHGVPNNVNAHPHQSNSGRIVAIHNGIIENYAPIKETLEKRGYTFQSDTDTEVLVNLIEEIQIKEETSLAKAVRLALNEVVGAYALVVFDASDPTTLVTARMGSPLAIGVGDNEFFVASDASPFIEFTSNAIYLEDGEMATIRLGKEVSVRKIANDKKVDPFIHELQLSLDEIEKGGYDHFMLKEIYEQPKAIRDTYRGRLKTDSGLIKMTGIDDHLDKFLNAKRIIIAACGTSWHAGLIGKHLIEEYARIPVHVEYASEFRYRNVIIDSSTIIIAISQSGETADTLAAIRKAKELGAITLGICNVVGSTISRETDAGIFTHTGPEIGVASTKAFTAQLTILIMLAIKLGRKKGVSKERGKNLINALRHFDQDVTSILKISDKVKKVAKKTWKSDNFLYLGRGINFPVALEGALKLKEISYIHAEGYPAAEMKHGPIALIDENMPVVFIAPQDESFSKILSNIEEVKARKGFIITITDKANTSLESLSNFILTIPNTHKHVFPITCSIILQMLAYELAVYRGCEIDQPRNLAKSVTVE